MLNFTLLSLWMLSVAPSPLEVVVMTHSGLSQQKGDDESKKKKFKALLDGNIDLPFVIDEALGAHRKDIKPEDLAHISEIFRDVLIESALERTEDGGFGTLGCKGFERLDAWATVPCRLTLRDGTVFDVNVMLRYRKGWRMVDVVSKNTRLSDQYRGTVDEMWREEGVTGVIDRLEARLAKLRNNGKNTPEFMKQSILDEAEKDPANRYRTNVLKKK